MLIRLLLPILAFVAVAWTTPASAAPTALTDSDLDTIVAGDDWKARHFDGKKDFVDKHDRKDFDKKHFDKKDRKHDRKHFADKKDKKHDRKHFVRKDHKKHFVKVILIKVLNSNLR